MTASVGIKPGARKHSEKQKFDFTDAEHFKY